MDAENRRFRDIKIKTAATVWRERDLEGEAMQCAVADRRTHHSLALDIARRVELFGGLCSAISARTYRSVVSKWVEQWGNRKVRLCAKRQGTEPLNTRLP